MRRFTFGRAKFGIALIPFFDTINYAFFISTREGNLEVLKGDGSAKTLLITDKNKDYSITQSGISIAGSYSSSFTGNMLLIFPKGLKDVYSICINTTHANNNNTKFIFDIENFFSQFPNLYSLYFFQNTNINSRKSNISGDFAKLPNSLEILHFIYLDSLNEIYLNISNYSPDSRLKIILQDSYGTPIRLIGDLAKLPPLINNIRLTSATSSSYLTYTSGKVWANAFDTLYLPVGLSYAENDNIYIDIDNSTTTAIGGKLIELKGYSTSLSDTAIASLISKGFSVPRVKMTIGTYFLQLLLSSNLADSSPSGNNATIVGTETHDLSALKTGIGNYAYIPNKTSLDIETGSIAFGCTVKFGSITGTKGLIGKTIAAAGVGRYGIYYDGGNLISVVQITSGNVQNSIGLSAYNDGNFHKIECICDRTAGKQYLYIDNILVNTQTFTPSSDNLTRNARFLIGGYGDAVGTGLLASSEFNGWIKDVFVRRF